MFRRFVSDCSSWNDLSVCQEMSCWVPYFCAWPPISPSILSHCALQRCCIWCRYVRLSHSHLFNSLIFKLFDIYCPGFPPLHVCICFLSASTSRWISGAPASGGSSCSISSCSSAACLSSSVFPSSSLARGTSCPPFTASCEWIKESQNFGADSFWLLALFKQISANQGHLFGKSQV